MAAALALGCLGSPSDAMAGVASRPVAVVDAGHGFDPVHGSFTGAYNRWAKVYEDSLNLDIARRVAAELAARGVEVHLTREGEDLPPDYNGDGELTNGDRAHFALHLRQLRPQAAKERADLYLSIHLNASPRPRVRGVTAVYSEVGAAQPYARASWRLAYAVHRQLLAALPESAPPFPVEGIYLDKLALPHAVVEVGFLTNPRDLDWVRQPENRKRAAELIAEGVVQWLAEEAEIQRRLQPEVAPEPGRPPGPERPPAPGAYRSPST